MTARSNGEGTGSNGPEDKGQNPPAGNEEHRQPGANTPPDSGTKGGTGNPEDQKGGTGNPEKFVPRMSDSAVKQVEDMVAAAGLDPKEVAATMMQEGTVSPAVYLKLQEKHGEGAANLIVSQLETLREDSKNKAAAQDKAVFTQLEQEFKGVTDQPGSKTWEELRTWAKENIPENERREINKVLAIGGTATKLAVQELVQRFKSQQGAQQMSQEQTAQLETGDATGNQTAGLISKLQYTQELNKLLAQGHDYNTSPEIAALRARRLRSMKRGV